MTSFPRFALFFRFHNTSVGEDRLFLPLKAPFNQLIYGTASTDKISKMSTDAQIDLYNMPLFPQ